MDKTRHWHKHIGDILHKMPRRTKKTAIMAQPGDFNYHFSVIVILSVILIAQIWTKSSVCNNSIDFGRRASVPFANVPQSRVNGIAYSTEITLW